MTDRFQSPIMDPKTDPPSRSPRAEMRVLKEASDMLRDLANGETFYPNPRWEKEYTRDAGILEAVAGMMTLVRRYFDPHRHSAIRDDRGYWQSLQESDALAGQIRAGLVDLDGANPHA